MPSPTTALIGLFGGTFDPFHLGHLHLGKTILSRYPLEKLFFIPTGRNPHKEKRAHATPAQRFEMVTLALAEWDEPKADTLGWEVATPGPHYTIDTLSRFKNKFPKVDPVLILGDEVFAAFSKWKAPREILEKAHLVVVGREAKEFDPTPVLTAVGISEIVRDPPNSSRYLLPETSRWIDFQDIHALPYSATEIRNNLGNLGNYEKISTLPQGIQRSVWLYIKENRLYSVNK